MMSEWVEKHKRAFAAKTSLYYYYREVFASLLQKELLPGSSLELGSGPGFLSDIVEDVTTSDINAYSWVKVVCDAHQLPFTNQTFSNVFFVDVLHHLRSPLTAFREISRVLKPAGRLVMIEPYTTPLSKLFYKYIHHEDCSFPKDVWEHAFPDEKDPLTGNAEIPHACLIKNNGPIMGDNPISGLRLHKIILFAGLSYLLTGGFSRSWQFPPGLIRVLYQIEMRSLPFWAPLAATRCLAVLERPT